MHLDQLREYCLAKPHTTESLPFDNKTLVFKVLSKIFVITDIESEILTFAAKCDPEKAIELRQQYDWVQPGYHLSKKHWNTLTYNGTNSKILKDLIDHSYQQVLASMTKKEKLLMQ